MKIYKLLLLSAFSFLTALGQYMPKGFEDIYLEMPWAEFIKARPNVYPALLAPEPLKETVLDPKNPMEGLMEKGDSQPFVFGYYLFQEGKLTGANLLFNVNLGLKENVLKSSFKRLGGFNDLALSKNLKKGTIQWNNKEKFIYAFLPMEFSSSDVVKLEYKRMGSANAELFENIRKQQLKGKEIDQLAFEGFKKRITAYAQAVLAEVEEQAEVTDAALKDTVKSKGEGPGQEGEYAETNYSESATQGLERSAIYLLLAFGVLVGGVLLLRCFK